MIFFISEFVGKKLILFLIKNYKKDISYIVIKSDDDSTLDFLKKNFDSSKILIWKRKNTKVIDLIKKIKPKKIFLLWWPLILKKNVIDLAKYEVINLHPSYLPYYKGKDPNFWSILNDGPFGVSIHRVTTKVDSGDILFRKKINNFDYSLNSKDLYEICRDQLVGLFKEKYFILRKNKITRGKNNLKKLKINKRKDMIKKSFINLEKSYKAKYLINLMRAKTFPPYEGVLFKKKNNIYSLSVDIKKIK
jgi:methionyl-tRNA formyltransferase